MRLGLGIGPGFRRPRGGGGGVVMRSTVEAALLGDSLVAYTHNVIGIPSNGVDTLAVNANVLSMDWTDYGFSHGLLPGGKLFGWYSTNSAYNRVYTAATTPTAQTLTAATTGLANGTVPGSPYTSWQMLNLSRYNEWGSWIPQWSALSGWPCDITTYACFGGMYASDLEDYRTQFITPSSAGLVFISAGTNDLFLNRTATAISGWISAVIDALIADGRTPVISTIAQLPGFSPTQEAERVALNAAILAMDNTRPALKVVDVDAALQDLATELMADQVHYSPKGAYVAAAAAQTALAGVVPTRDILPTAGSTTLNVNPLLSGTGGSKSGTGVTGDVADNMTVTASAASLICTCSKETRGSHGDNQVLTFGTTANNQACRLETASLVSGLSAGDTIYGVAEIQVSNLVNLRGLVAGFSITDGLAYTGFNACNWGFPSTANLAVTLISQTSKTLTVRTPNITLANVPTVASFAVRVVFGGNGSGSVLKVGRMAVFKV